jgi:hypothetical protein
MLAKERATAKISKKTLQKRSGATPAKIRKSKPAERSGFVSARTGPVMILESGDHVSTFRINGPFLRSIIRDGKPKYEEFPDHALAVAEAKRRVAELKAKGWRRSGQMIHVPKNRHL